LKESSVLTASYGKLVYPDVILCLNSKGIAVRQRSSLEMALNVDEKGFIIQKALSDCKR